MVDDILLVISLCDIDKFNQRFCAQRWAPLLTDVLQALIIDFFFVNTSIIFHKFSFVVLIDKTKQKWNGYNTLFVGLIITFFHSKMSVVFESRKETKNELIFTQKSNQFQRRVCFAFFRKTTSLFIIDESRESRFHSLAWQSITHYSFSFQRCLAQCMVWEYS